MTTLSIQPPYPIITGADGRPLESGYIWIGTANLNPITNPIAVYWDAALTQPAAQPIRTSGGYPVNAGTPARLYVGGDYSILVQDRKGSTVYSAPAATERYSDPVVTGISSAEVSFLQAGSGAVTRTVQSKLRDVVSVRDFGAVGDGIADDTVAIQTAAAALQNGQALDFGNGTYLISYQGAPYSSVYGNVVANFLNKLDISLIGDGATIKVANHNITTNGGLRFANFKGCKRVCVSGLNFDMTFAGTNTSGAFYPFCGAITAIDNDADLQPQSSLNSDFLIQNCTFKLFHPWGQYVQTGAPFSGDQNNGYKIFSVFLSGPYLGSTYEHQSRNVVISNCKMLKGHNGYGFWIWAWNNINVEKCVADNWVAKYSNTSGAILGGGIAFIRYHQFLCSGIAVNECNFVAKPCSERTVAGFEGNAVFCALDTNLTGDHVHGQSSVGGNNIRLGNGDGANSLPDYGVLITLYGQVEIYGNNFDGAANTVNAYGGTHIFYNAAAAGGNGVGALIIDGNIFGRISSYFDSIRIANGRSESDYYRRLKQLVVTNNVSQSQLQYFFDLDASGTAAFSGCRNVVIHGNVVDGTYNTVYNSSSTNSIGINYNSSVSSDQAAISMNQIRSKYYGLWSAAGSVANSPFMSNNLLLGVTSSPLVGILWDIASGTPEGSVAAKVGSMILRTNGGANTTLYIKESGSGNTGWVAK